MSHSSIDLEGTALYVSTPEPAMSPVFVVDDEPGVRRVVAAVLRKDGYPVKEFEHAHAALDALENEEISLLITDISMPGINGVELAERALGQVPDLAVIIFTGVPDSVTAVQSLRIGVADYLTKPVDMETLRGSVHRTLRRRAEIIRRRELESWLRGEVAKRTRDLESLSVSTLVALVRAMEAKDPYLRGGSERIARLSELMARHLEMEPAEVEAVRTAGLLHDIGMISTPEAILHKPSQLTSEEFSHIKNHVEVGITILSSLGHLEDVIEFIRYHHERINGSGYPEGLRGEEIPLGAQIVGLADSFNALTMERPFRAAVSAGEALQILRAGQGIWFTGRLLDALERAALEEERQTGGRP
jgi:putative nucleotidyltransferase with HDIG domain